MYIHALGRKHTCMYDNINAYNLSLCKHLRVLFISHCQEMKDQEPSLLAYTKFEVDEETDQTADLKPGWIRQHCRVFEEFAHMR